MSLSSFAQLLPEAHNYNTKSIWICLGNFLSIAELLLSLFKKYF